MKVLSALLLTFIFILTACSNSGSGQEVSAVSIDTSKYLRVAGVSASNNTPVPIEKYVLLTFSSAIDETTVDESSVYIEDEDSVPVPSALTVSGEKISIIPYAFFLPDTAYTIVVTTAVEDTEGRTLENTFTSAFVTASLPDTTAPLLVSVTPDVNAEAVKTTNIIMEFDEIIAGNGELELKNDTADLQVTGTATMSDTNLSFVPDNDLVPGNNYTVTMQGIVEDLAGNAYSGMTSWSFFVISAFELKVVSVTHTGRAIRVAFSEDLNTSTVNESDFAINGGSITFDHFLIKDEIEVQFIADSNIDGDENISVSGTIQDINGVSHNDGVTAIYPLGFEI